MLLVLTANNNVFAQSENDGFIIDLKRIFPYGLPKNIKGYAMDHKGKDSLFLDMKFEIWQTYQFSPYYEREDDLVTQIINGKDTVDYYYHLVSSTMHPQLCKDFYIGFKENDIKNIAIIKYSISKKTDIESEREEGINTRLVLNKEGFAKWALDIPSNFGYGGYVFDYDSDRITSINSPHGNNWRDYDNMFDVFYPKWPVSGPNGSVLLFSEGTCWLPLWSAFEDKKSCSYYYDPKNPIYNRSGIMVNMLLDDFYPSFTRMRRDLYYAGLLGLPCPYLPNASCSSVTFFYEYHDIESLAETILINSTYTWTFSNFKNTKPDESESKTIELPIKVVIDNTFNIEEEEYRPKLTRAQKKEMLDKFKTKYKYPKKVIFTFEW